jgi:bifunctional NMN adenylyltransferase/nudix hydrolase
LVPHSKKTHIFKQFIMSEIKKGYGAVVGRFQSPYLHPGHEAVIKQVLQKHENLVIFVGLPAGQHSDKNPLDFTTRKLMIQASYPNAIILPLKDMKSDWDWSKELDRRLSEVIGVHSAVLYGGRDSFIPHYHGKFPVSEFVAPDIIWSATAIREEVIQKSIGSEDFRAGVIYGITNRYPSPYPTVDVAITRDGNVLMGKKRNENGFRFVGGFVDPTDESYLAAAKREAAEETGGSLELSDWRYVCDMRIDDWRYRSTREKVMTIFYTCECSFGTPEATDDIAFLKWVPVTELCNTEIEPEHQPLVKAFIDYLNKTYASSHSNN